MNSMVIAAPASVLITCFVFITLRYKWCLYQGKTWYGLMACACIINVCINFCLIKYLHCNLVYICLLNFPLVIGEVPLSILPFFYRDPERSTAKDRNVIISPADGKVIYVKRVESGRIPLSVKGNDRISLEELSGTPLLSQGNHVIGICMNYLDVHVNRSPVNGIIRKLVHIQGTFLSLRHPESVVKNERQTILIEGDKIQIGVVQIASRLVRRIISYVNEGDTVISGQRIGAIRFGSQVDVIIPSTPSCNIKVKVDDVVRAGITILADFVE
ncbi:MAG: phosphatidylserine decarboxylase family protein [Candidatus Latescibacteria bacterium]|nr:phosphatidylserine decarboxylase family protein [Candidatus Latescibacterota bacterium]